MEFGSIEYLRLLQIRVHKRQACMCRREGPILSTAAKMHIFIFQTRIRVSCISAHSFDIG